MEGFQNVTEMNWTLSVTSPTLVCIPGSKVIETDSDTHQEFIKYFPYPFEPETYPVWELTLKITSYVIAMLLGIVGNALVVIVVTWNKRMRSLTNVYICNLAVSDLIVCGWCMWIHLGKNITAEWPFGEFFCKVSVFIQGMYLVHVYCMTIAIPSLPHSQTLISGDYIMFKILV